MASINFYSAHNQSGGYNYYQADQNGVLTQLSTNPIAGDQGIGKPAGLIINPNSLPSGLSFAPSTAPAGTNVSGSSYSPTSGVTSTLGGTPLTPPTVPPTVDPTASGSQQQGEAMSANQATVAALQAQEKVQQQELQQSQQGETAGYAQTAATLASIGGISSQWTNFFSNLNEQHQTNLQALQSQYQSAIAAADTGLANQIIQIQQNTMTTQAQQQQQFFENAMSVFNAQVGLIQNQTTNQNAAATLQLQQQNQDFTQSQATLSNFQNELNSILPTVSGQGWSNLSQDQQQQLTTMAQNAGIAPAVLQSVVNTKTVASTATATDLWGNSTVVALDKSGNVLRTINLGGGIDPSSQAGQQILQGFTTVAPASGFQYVNTGNLPPNAKSEILTWAAKNSITILSPTMAAAATQFDTSLAQLDNIQTKIETDFSQLAISSPDVATGFLGRSLDQLLQVTSGSSDPNATAFNQDLATLESLNTQLIGPLKSAADMTGAGGIGLNAILTKSGSSFITPNQTMQTILGNLSNLKDGVTISLQSLGWKGGTTTTQVTPQATSAANDIMSSLFGTGTSGNSGSTSSAGANGGTSGNWWDNLNNGIFGTNL